MKYVTKHPVKLCSYAYVCTEHVTSSEALVSACRTNVGCPKKFSQPWNSVMKRAYITAETCVKFCQVCFVVL